MTGVDKSVLANLGGRAACVHGEVKVGKERVCFVEDVDGDTVKELKRH